METWKFYILHLGFAPTNMIEFAHMAKKMAVFRVCFFFMYMGLDGPLFLFLFMYFVDELITMHTERAKRFDDCVAHQDSPVG